MAVVKKRLTSWELKRVLKRGVKWSGEFWRLRAVYSGSRHFRLAIIVSKKDISKAVERNRCRRRVREAFRESSGSIVGWDIAIFSGALALGGDFAKLKGEARKCLDSLLSKQSEFTKRR